MEEEKDWTLRCAVINAGCERRGKRGRDAGRAWYTSRDELLMEHLEKNGEQV